MLQRQASAILGGVVQARYRADSKQDALHHICNHPGTPSHRLPPGLGGGARSPRQLLDPLQPRYMPMDYGNRYNQL